MVTDLDDGLVLPQVPDDGFATRVGRGQDVLNLPVPGHNADVFGRLKEETDKVSLCICAKQISGALITPAANSKATHPTQLTSVNFIKPAIPQSCTHL